MKYTQKDVDYLLSPVAVRERSKKLYEHALQGKTHFKINANLLPEVSKYVLEVTRSNYPSLDIPFHSRFGHFQAGKVDRLKILDQKLLGLSPIERARTKVDLAIVSVLLDAGAGMAWKYKDPFSEATLSKSEGLAVASLDLFLKGAFHSEQKIGADGLGLQRFTKETLESGFQVTGANPLLGVEGRVKLLNTLGKLFEGSRPGALVDEWVTLAKASPDGKTLKASSILNLILKRLGPIWPGRLALGEVNLGDVWYHPLLGSTETTDALVPFHKLSQWMSYSLIEPLTECGLTVVGLDELTGLPEYRNGGLLLDSKLIELRDPDLALVEHAPDSELVVEWRALTVTLLDRIGSEVRRMLGKDALELPLVKILEGGTWHAGRKLAAKLRSDGGPPLKIKSDGTVF